MITLPLGFILTIAVVIYSTGMSSSGLYLNDHALMIVVGGTFTIFIFSNPSRVIKSVFKHFFDLFKSEKSFEEMKSELVNISLKKSQAAVSKDELVAYAQELWKQGTSQELFVVLLSQKKQEIEQRSTDSNQSLKNLAKYPPALGMAGTVIGVVTLFQTLDQNRERVGSALALAMTATFFGLIVANIFVMPIADRLQIKHISYKQYLQNLYQILLLINQDEPGQLIADEVELRGA